MAYTKIVVPPHTLGGPASGADFRDLCWIQVHDSYEIRQQLKAAGYQFGDRCWQKAYRSADELIAEVQSLALPIMPDRDDALFAPSTPPRNDAQKATATCITAGVEDCEILWSEARKGTGAGKFKS